MHLENASRFLRCRAFALSNRNLTILPASRQIVIFRFDISHYLLAGQMVQGGQNIFFAQLADSAKIAHFSADATRYFSGEFIFMIFGLPGA